MEFDREESQVCIGGTTMNTQPRRRRTEICLETLKNSCGEGQTLLNFDVGTKMVNEVIQEAKIAKPINYERLNQLYEMGRTKGKRNQYLLE